MCFRKPVQIVWRYDESGERVRVSKRSGRIIPIPVLEEETYDYKTKKTYYGKFSLNFLFILLPLGFDSHHSLYLQ